MKQQQQHWKNMVNMCINNKCLFTLHPRFANRGKRTRRKKREHRHGRFFPPSLSISHIEEPRRCWSVTQPSILSFFLFPSFLPLRWRIKKKEKKGMVVDRTRHAELRGKMPWKLVLSMLGFIEKPILPWCTRVSTRRRLRGSALPIHPRVNPVIELSIEEQCENESTGLIKLEIEIRGKKLGGRSHLDN